MTTSLALVRHTAAASLVLFSTISLTGCKNDIERLVELEETKAELYTKAGDNCDDLAKAAEEFKSKHGADHKELMKKLEEQYKDKKDDAKKAMEPYKDRADKAKKVIVGAVIKCANHDGFGKAIKND
jgi:gas vesicle protein